MRDLKARTNEVHAASRLQTFVEVSELTTPPAPKHIAPSSRRNGEWGILIPIIITPLMTIIIHTIIIALLPIRFGAGPAEVIRGFGQEH